MTAGPSALTWQEWLAIFSVAFGVLGLAVGFVSYVSQRRSTVQTAALAKWAQLSADKTLSESDIKNLSLQKTAMQEEVSRKIPAIAREAVLREQLTLHEQAIAEHAHNLELIRRELNSETALSSLDPAVRQAIFDRILPRYERHERRDRIRTRITVLAVALAVGATMIPAPGNTIFVFFVGLLLIYTSARLYALNEEPTRAFNKLRPLCHLSYAASILVLLAMGIFMKSGTPLRSAKGYGAMAIMAAGGLLAISYFFARTRIDHFANLLCGTQPMAWISKKD